MTEVAANNAALGAKRQADAGTRTPDPFITSEVLYQLSYVGARKDASDAIAACGDSRPRQPATPAPRLASSSSSDSPCFSQKDGPIPRISSSAAVLCGPARSTSSSTALEATV
jgi:hypothetical protein